MAVFLGLLRGFAQAFDLVLGDVEGALEIYAQDLSDLPGPVLIAAFKRLRSRWRYRSMPKPGDIRAEAEKVMEGWTITRLRLETVARKMRMEARKNG